MKTIRFSRLRFVMITMSIVLIATGATVTVLRGGFNLGIDFQAGMSMRVAIDPAVAQADTESVRAALSAIDGAQVQTIGDSAEQQFVIRVSDSGEIDSFATVMSDNVLSGLRDGFGDNAVTELETSFVGPRFSQDLAQNTIVLTLLALVVILIYIWFRFRLGYATAAIVALLHDVSFMVVFIGALQIEVSTATIAAVLTIIGYSLNDTIVIFDRIRENETIMRESGFETVINASITQSLSRTLITSLTTLLAVTAIYVFATGSVQLFALNLIVGIIVGTYSSIFIASPVLYAWVRSGKRRRRGKRPGVPAAAKAADAPKSAPQASQGTITEEDKQRVIEEISRKKATSGGKSKSRAQRKKK